MLKKRKITGLCIKSRRFQIGNRDCRLIVYPRGVQCFCPANLLSFSVHHLLRLIVSYQIYTVLFVNYYSSIRCDLFVCSLVRLLPILMVGGYCESARASGRMWILCSIPLQPRHSSAFDLESCIGIG